MDRSKALEDLARSWEDRSLPRGLSEKVRAFWGGSEAEPCPSPGGEIAREDLMDCLEEEDPAFQEALRKALAEESLPLSEDELRALILDP